ncbi:MAG TPA: hypothetical protein VFG45_12975 [Candidatus Nitrosocosmicus sp.]|nr:hypothetical protein [Candidatus Nitrosocosmicus sp.]
MLQVKILCYLGGFIPFCKAAGDSGDGDSAKIDGRIGIEFYIQAGG